MTDEILRKLGEEAVEALISGEAQLLGSDDQVEEAKERNEPIAVVEGLPEGMELSFVLPEDLAQQFIAEMEKRSKSKEN